MTTDGIQQYRLLESYTGPAATGSQHYMYYTEWQSCYPPATVSLLALSAAQPGKSIPVSASITRNGQPASSILVVVDSPTPLGGTLSCPSATDSTGSAICTYQSPAKGSASVRQDQIAATCPDCQNTARAGVTLLALNTCPIPPVATEAGAPGPADGDMVGNPIHPATGEKSQIEVDYVDQGPYPLDVIRSYRTAFGENGVVATWDWIGSARIAGDSLVSHVMFGDGRVRSFIYEAVGNTGDYRWQPLGHTGTLTVLAGNTGWTYVDGEDDSTWTFNANSLATSRMLRNGWTINYGYTSAGQLNSIVGPFGRGLAFTYNSFGLIDSATTPAGTTVTYQYDSQSRLIGVLFPDGKSKTYLYEDTNFPRLLTGVTDENQLRHSTYTYDTQGRAVSTEHAGGTERYIVTYTGTHSVTVTDPLNTMRAYTYGDQGAVSAVLSADKPPLGTEPAIASRQQDSLGFITSETNFLGVTTLYTWDVNRRLPLSTTRAFTKPEAQTITTQWHPTLQLPTLITEPNRTTTFTYDVAGNLLSRTVMDISNPSAPVSRSVSWTYNTSNLPQTMTDSRGKVWQYGYDGAGNPTSVTNPLGHTTSYLYDTAGRVTQITDPNGVMTTYSYNLRQRLQTVSVAGKTTSYTYDAAGQLTKVTRPDASWIAHEYDAAQRRVASSDSQGNRIEYTLDNAGNVLVRQVKDPAGTLKRAMDREMDALGRVQWSIGGM